MRSRCWRCAIDLPTATKEKEYPIALRNASRPQAAHPDRTAAHETVMADHILNAVLEEYSLRALAKSTVAAVEEHLLVCPRCRAWLDAIEPVNFVHFTEYGPIYSRATLLTTGEVMARHWGKGLDIGRECRSISAARKYLIESFSQMFPEHTCRGQCGPTQERRRNPS